MRRHGRGRRWPAALRVAVPSISTAFALAVAAAGPAGAASAASPSSAVSASSADGVYLEALTWTELRARIAAGATAALVPIGGTEQSGPYVALGKHNARAHALAGRIAERLGDAIVAPTLAYVPEGPIDPPGGHMRFPGTISIPDAAFEAVLEGTARSLRRAGFRTIVFLGDHGDYQKNEERVAAKLNREWAAGGDRAAPRVLALVEYYRAAASDFPAALEAQGYPAAEVGTHAGLADTALTQALAPQLVRSDALAKAPKPGVADGTHGDPRRATAALGRMGVERIVERSVERIRALAR